jgi:hypothetical protein
VKAGILRARPECGVDAVVKLLPTAATGVPAANPP